jgi:hypothetical protein
MLQADKACAANGRAEYRVCRKSGHILPTDSAIMCDSNGAGDSEDAKTNGIGAMSDAKWDAIFSQMSTLGLHPATLNYRAAYTLDFVNKKVGQ